MADAEKSVSLSAGSTVMYVCMYVCRYFGMLCMNEARHCVCASVMDIDKLETYFESLEIYVHDTVNRLWLDISRYGPGLPSFPEVHLPLGDFQVPPPPPPPPPPTPTSWLDNSCTWVSKHPWKTVGLVIGVAGTGLLLAGYTKAYARRPRSQAARMQRNERRQVVGMCRLDSHGLAGSFIQMQSF